MSAVGVADLALGHLRLREAQGDGPITALGGEYGAATGSMPLREAVAAWQRTAPEAVAITTGASLGLVATLATLPRGTSVLIPRPGYPAYAHVATALGLDARHYDLNPARCWQPTAESLARGLREKTTGVLLCQPNNPTGRIADADVLEEIAEVVRPARPLVICDETYAELLFDDASVPDPRAVFPATDVVRILSFSKLFGMPGERLGCVIGAPSRIRRISRAHWIFAMSPPATAQVMALTMLRSGTEGRIRTLRTVLAAKRERAAELLAQHCREFSFRRPSGGCFMWIEVLDCPLDSATFARRCADDGGVIVMPGEAFGVADPTYVRASFAVPDAELVEGFRRLGRVAAGLRATPIVAAQGGE